MTKLWTVTFVVRADDLKGAQAEADARLEGVDYDVLEANPPKPLPIAAPRVTGGRDA